MFFLILIETYYYCNFTVCCLFSAFTPGFRSLDHELGRGRTGSSGLGRRFKSAEKRRGMTNTRQKEIITVYACEFVPACSFVGNNSCAA